MNFENPALSCIPDKFKDNSNKYHMFLGATLSTILSLDDGQSLTVVATSNYDEFCDSQGLKKEKVRTPPPKNELILLPNGMRINQCNGTKSIPFLRTKEGIVLFVPPSTDYALHVLELSKDYITFTSCGNGCRSIKFSLQSPIQRHIPFGYDEIDPNRKTIVVLGNVQQICAYVNTITEFSWNVKRNSRCSLLNPNMSVDINCMMLECRQKNFDVLWIAMQTPLFGDLAQDVGSHFASISGVGCVCYVSLDFKKTFVSSRKNVFAPSHFSIWSDFGLKELPVENDAGKLIGSTCAKHVSFPTLCCALNNYERNDINANSFDCCVSYLANGVHQANKGTKFASFCSEDGGDYEDVAVEIARYFEKVRFDLKLKEYELPPATIDYPATINNQFIQNAPSAPNANF